MTRAYAHALRLLAVAVVASSVWTPAVAQTGVTPSTESLATPDKPRPALAAPIEIAGAKTRVVTAEILSRLTGRPFREAREVLDISVAVKAEDLNAMPDALQPRLFIGRSAYPVQRVEYDNWDLKSERPIDPGKPVGVIRYLHFLVFDWRDLAQGEPMFLSVLSLRRVLEITNGEPNASVIARELPDTDGKIPPYDPAAFQELDP